MFGEALELKSESTSKSLKTSQTLCEKATAFSYRSHAGLFWKLRGLGPTPEGKGKREGNAEIHCFEIRLGKKASILEVPRGLGTPSFLKGSWEPIITAEFVNLDHLKKGERKNS